MEGRRDVTVPCVLVMPLMYILIQVPCVTGPMCYVVIEIKDYFKAQAGWYEGCALIQEWQ